MEKAADIATAVAAVLGITLVMLPAVCGYLLIRSLRREAKGLERFAKHMAELRRRDPDAYGASARLFKDTFK